MANCSRSSSSSLMLSLCLPPSMVYPEGASNTHGGISPARHDTAAHRGKVKGKRREGYLTVEEIILKEKNRRESVGVKRRNKSKSKLYQVFFFFYVIAAKIFPLINNGVHFCKISSRISREVPSEWPHNKLCLPSAWLQI